MDTLFNPFPPDQWISIYSTQTLFIESIENY